VDAHAALRSELDELTATCQRQEADGSSLKEELERMKAEHAEEVRKAKEEHDKALDEAKSKLEAVQAAADSARSDAEDQKHQVEELEERLRLA